MCKKTTEKEYWRGIKSDDFGSSDICLFGIAADEHCSVGRGAAKAPQEMRECSAFLPPFTMAGKKIPPKLFDLGDIEGYDYEKAEKFLSLALEKKLAVVLGGDHSISMLTQKAFRKKVSGKLGIIHIDAHADICDVYDGSEYSHACVLRRALDNGFSEEDIVMVGIRSYEEQEVNFLANSKIKVYSPEALTPETVEEIISKFRGYDGVYISFDIDAVDPAFAPGTGTPEAFGLHSKTVLGLLIKLFEKLPVRVFDLVEVSPPLDVNDITVWLALKYLLEIFGVVCSDN